MRRMGWGSLIVGVLGAVLCGSALSLSTPDDVFYEAEYQALLENVEDTTGLKAIRNLHQQLDDDKDGTIEPSETGDFIKADLKLVLEGNDDGNDDDLVQFDGDGRREKLFHKKDNEITVSDLWTTWASSEVYNWTVQQTVDWLSNSLELPQYAQVFLDHGVNGTKLPLAASDNSFLSKKLGVTNPIHRSKISLKAMDVVLFGPPKEPSNWLKDIILSLLLVALVSALVWAYNQKKRSEEHLAKMMKDMESLTNAEKMLQEMQSKVGKSDLGSYSQLDRTVVGEEEVDRLREEVEILRGELHRAEVELEDKCWVAPTILQHWLQLTYEIESQAYNEKRRSAEYQMEQAKDACERLKRKRSSLVGAFVSTHGRSIDDVDKSILEAKTALLELTQDLGERSRRWRQVEMLTGVSIVNNPGLITLQKIVKYVGGGNKMRTGMSSRMSNMSLDELHDDDTRSVAASSHVSSHVSVSRPVLTRDQILPRDPGLRRTAYELSRESSKESSNSESDDHFDRPKDMIKSRISQTSMSSDTSRLSQFSEGKATRASTPPLSSSPLAIRRTRMVKSYSQDASSDVAVPAMSSSTSDSALQSNHKLRASQHVLDEIEESCSASDTGSINDLEGKKKKKKSFFNFRRKKDKLETLS